MKNRCPPPQRSAVTRLGPTGRRGQPARRAERHRRAGGGFGLTAPRHRKEESGMKQALRRTRLIALLGAAAQSAAGAGTIAVPGLMRLSAH